MPAIQQQRAGPTQKRVQPGMTPSSKPGVLGRIAPIGFGEDDGIQILLYGRSGTGKTTLWSTFPKPILAIICSGGMNPGELRSIDTEDNREGIFQVVLQSAMEMKQLTDHLAGSKEYGTVVLDHASGFQDLILKEVVGLSEIPVAKTWGLATQQQYGQVTLQAKEMLRGLLGLKANVVIVAQERESHTENTSDLILPTVGAGLMPQLAGWLYTAVDYIGQTFISSQYETKIIKVGTGANAKEIEQRIPVKGAVQYCLRTLPDAVYTTKFRVPKGRQLADIVDPSYEKIIQLIKGE